MTLIIRRLLIKIWNINPLIFIGAMLISQLLLIISGRLPALLLTTALVMGLAYLQNTTYAMQSRAGMRNSNLYHLLAAVGASLAYFWSLQLLVHNKLTLVLLVPYVFATVIATVHGNKLSIYLEKMLGIYVEDLRGKPQFLKLWPSVAILMAFLVWQIFNLGTQGLEVTTFKGENLILGLDTLVILIFLGIAGSFSFALLRTARSSDSYWFHALAFLLSTCVDFAKLAILVNFNLNWQLFLPVTTGSVIGSLVGANLALNIATRIQAKFDVHVFKQREMQEREQSGNINWPITQIVWLVSILTVQVFAIFLGFADVITSVVLLILSAWQQMSFTLKSRAGQRNNSLYLSWSSVFSNGVWYITMAPLAMGGITPDKAIPYIIGGAIGSLVGQLAGMRVERATGALASTLPQKPIPTIMPTIK